MIADPAGVKVLVATKPRWGPRGGRDRAIDLTHHNFLTR
jgi:hypothetical protein